MHTRLGSMKEVSAQYRKELKKIKRTTKEADRKTIVAREEAEKLKREEDTLLREIEQLTAQVRGKTSPILTLNRFAGNSLLELLRWQLSVCQSARDGILAQLNSWCQVVRGGMVSSKVIRRERK